MGTGTGEEQAAGAQQRVLPVSDQVWTLPNLLSFVRLVLVPVFVWLLVERELGWAALLLVVAGFSDFADGKIARHYGLVSRLGQVLDPIADRLYIAATVLGLAAVGAIPWWLVAVLVARDAFILSMYPVVRRRRLPIPEVSFIGKAATFNLLGGFPLILLGQLDGWWTVLALATGWALAWWGTVLYWVAGLVYAWQVLDMVRQRRAQEVPV
ncbi:CDP-alcohol phosphatidyltransferase family protein [Ornithinimicrobium pratense]|uniref:CDP-alcohol phosphatidyltransferase family protein n=1 Tax=Ornithinimicrobium pratense TaxID=2593973 RepID=A0A5J6V3W9_9MICO|nr:CDP-alcohol phosphatidyltransferase family protein [Ornithinimicrobium pratense]QFG68589.1 CDP-alcohol phosphatidyltransferase family protein [Ornithinimicrobium pratense]